MTRGAELKLSMAYDYLPLVVNWGASACMFMLLTNCCRFSQEFILTTGFMSKQSSEHGYLSDVGPAFIHARTLERGKLLTKTIEASRDQNNRINIHEARIKIAVKNSSAASMAGLYPRPKVGQCPARYGVHL